MPGYKLPAEEDQKGERRDGDDGMPETLLPLFVLLVKQQKRASIYLAGFLEPMTKKVGKRCVHHRRSSIGFFKEDWTVWRLLIAALYCQDWANASFRSSSSSTTEDYYPPSKAPLRKYRSCAHILCFISKERGPFSFSLLLQKWYLGEGYELSMWFPFTNLVLVR